VNELVVLAASAAVVVFMVAVAYVLGFRDRARIDDAALAGLAAAEAVGIESVAIAVDGRAALARLTDERLLLARVMGADVSARIAPAGAARLALRKGKVFAAFGDPGFPRLILKLEAPPRWILDLAAGQGG